MRLLKDLRPSFDSEDLVHHTRTIDKVDGQIVIELAEIVNTLEVSALKNVVDGHLLKVLDLGWILEHQAVVNFEVMVMTCHTID